MATQESAPKRASVSRLAMASIRARGPVVSSDNVVRRSRRSAPTNSRAMFSPRSVTVFSPSMNTGAAGASPVPGSEMPMLAWRDSPGPLTTQPITASVRFSAPGWRDLPFRHLRAHVFLHRLRQFLEELAVVRPQPGQAVTIGVNARRPMVCSSSCATMTSCVRDCAGFGRERDADGVADAFLQQHARARRWRRRCPCCRCRLRSGRGAARNRCATRVRDTPRSVPARR